MRRFNLITKPDYQKVIIQEIAVVINEAPDLDSVLLRIGEFNVSIYRQENQDVKISISSNKAFDDGTKELTLLLGSTAVSWKD